MDEFNALKKEEMVKLNYVCKVKSKRFNSVNDSKFYMMQEVSDEKSNFKVVNRIIKIKIYYAEYHYEVVYQEEAAHELIEFGLDDFQGKLILLSKPSRKKNNDKSEQRFFKIFDLEKR